MRPRLHQLRPTEELGDRRPSQLPRRIRQVLGNCALEDASLSLLREMFLQRLSRNLLMVLAAADDMPLDRLADRTDRVAECTIPHRHIAATTSAPDPDHDRRSASATSRQLYYHAELVILDTRASTLTISPSGVVSPVNSFSRHTMSVPSHLW